MHKFLKISFFFFTFSSFASPEHLIDYYKFIEIPSGKVILEKNSKSLIKPASTLKNFTAYHALKILGPEFKFKTIISSSKKPKNAILESDLILKFDGNPDLTFEEIEKMILSLGIRKIQGKIIIDDSEFDQKYYPFGFSIDNLNMCYAAPISPIIVNGNCFHAKIEKHQNKAKIIRTHKHDPLIKNDIQLTQNPSNCTLELESNDQNQFKIHGCHHQDSDEPLNLKIAHANPRKMIENVIKHILKEHSIKFSKIIFKKSPEKQTILAFAESRILREIIKDFLLHSNNLIGNVLFKKIDHLSQTPPVMGKWNSGIQTFTEFFVNEGIFDASENDFSIFDGSGISRKNLINADSMIKLLTKISQSPEMMKIFLESMPNAGKTGTLKESFKNLQNVEIIAKTGYLENGPSALAGYVLQQGVPTHAFYHVIDNFALEFKQIRKIQEDLMVKLIEKIEFQNGGR